MSLLNVIPVVRLHMNELMFYLDLQTAQSSNE